MIDDVRNATCAGKHSFEDPNLARKVAHRAKNKGARKMSVYKCPFCRMWHIGASESNRISGGKSRV